jgi:hypothetical protein
MEHIKTFEDACKALNLDPEKVLPDISTFPPPHQKALTATAKLFIVADALNEGWQPNWNDGDEYKYYPWFDLEKDEDVNPSGFRFHGVSYYYTNSDVGSRLCFKSRDVAQYAGTQFIDLYRDLFIL